jgi:hypothetical protein
MCDDSLSQNCTDGIARANGIDHLYFNSRDFNDVFCSDAD